MYKLYTLFEALQICGKVGVDVRKRTGGEYVGFCYNYTMDEARKNKALIEKNVKRQVTENADIYIKRGCTEMEMQQPSSEWKVDKWQEAIEQELESIVSQEAPDYEQTKESVDRMLAEWVEHEWSVGADWKRLYHQIYREPPGGPLYEPSVRYE